MHTHTIQIELLIDGHKATVGHQFLEDTVRQIPDIEANKPIFDILAASDNPNVRRALTAKEFLSPKTVHTLLSDPDREVVEGILSNSHLAQLIRPKALKRILAADDVELLTTIGANIEDYTRCDTCSIADQLSRHPNPLVRYSLPGWMVSDVVSSRILKRLANDKDPDVAQRAAMSLEQRG